MKPQTAEDRHSDRDSRQRRTLDHGTILALLFVGGLVISGFTLRRGIEAFDEGLTLQAGRRVAEGQLPYRDFLWAYGPAWPYLLAALFKLFGTSLLWWRIIRVLVDAGVAVMVFVIVGREAPRRIALASWLIAICAMAQPTGTNPFAPALFCSLGALWCAAYGRTRGMAVAAGALCALAAVWRPDFGAYAALAACAAALARPDRRDRPKDHDRRFARAALIGGAFVLLAAVVYLPFVIADGPAAAWRDLVGRSLDTGRYWHLPFPLAYDGRSRLWPPGAFAHDAKDVLDFYVPLLLVIGLAAAAIVLAARRLHRQPILVGLAVLGLGYLSYLLSRTDEFHTTPLLIALAALLPLLALRTPMRGAAVLGVILLALLAYGAANRLSALLRPPQMASLSIPVGDGVEAPPAEARAVEQMVAAVQRRVPPGQPIYTITRRSDLVRVNDPLIYVLTERDNPTRQDFGLQTGARAQAQIVAALSRARPKAIVRWTSPESTKREPNARGRPTGIHTLDRWVANNYRRTAQFGYYQLLVPRQP